MATLVSTKTLQKHLEAENYPLPADCREVRLIAAPGEALLLQFECFVDVDHLAALGRAIQRMAEELR